MPLKSTTVRYGAVAISIHWLTALAILLLFVTGLSAANATDPAVKLALLRAHVPFGLGVLLLTAIRIVWWLAFDRRPALPADEPAWQKQVARLTHYGLYILMLLMVSSGIATLALGGAIPALLSGAALPDLETLIPRTAHGIMARLLLALLALHIGAALYHQFVRRDRLLARMGVGQA